MKRQIANKTNTGSGTFEVLDRALEWVKFRADKIGLKCTFTIKNTNAGSQTLLAENFFENTRLSIFTRDGEQLYEDVPLRVVEWVSQLEERGYVDGVTATALDADTLVECVDVSITAVSGATQDVTVFLEINFAQPLAERPLDYSQSLYQLKRIVMKPGSTGDSDLTVTGVQVIALAEGEETDYFYAGIRKKVSVQPSDVSKSQQLVMNGYLGWLGMYSLLDGTSPIDADGPNVEIDGATVIDASDLSALDLQRYMGFQADGGLFPKRSTLTQTQWATLLGVSEGFQLGKLPRGNALRVQFAAIAGTAQQQQFALVEFIAKTPKARRDFPGGLQRTPGEMAQDIELARLSSGDTVNADIANFLPEKVKTPEAIGAPA